MYTSITAANVKVGMEVAIPNSGKQFSKIVSVDYHADNKEQLIVSVKNAPYAFVVWKWAYLIVTVESVLYPNNHDEILSWLEAPA